MWNQWGAQPPATPGFQAAAYPPAPAASTTAAPPPGGFPMGYPFYPTSAMPPTAAAMPGYTAAQQWSMPQQQQWQQWEQWQQQYSQWQQQYGDKYQAQMMMGGGGGIPPLPAQGDVAVNPPLPTDMKDQQQIQAKDADNYGNNTTYSQGGMQVSDLPTKRPHESSTEDTSSPQQANKKARVGDDKEKDTDDSKSNKESQEEPSDAEKAFDTQFKNWEEQFLKWKEQNSNHPDKNQYKEYEAKWESWREQLMQRREQMRKKRETKLADDSKLSSLNEAPPSISEPKASPSIPPLSTNIQKPMPPVSIPPMQNPSQNPIAMQGMGFPPFNNPPPMVQNSMVQPGMGFPNFGNQHYPSFPSQPPGYGMPPAPFQAQPMYPGMAGMNMMCPPPAIVNPNTPDLGSSNTISQLPPSKKESAPTGNQGDKSQDNSNFLNKSEGNNKGIPGLDLVEGGASGRNSEDTHSQAPPKQLPPNAAPLHTSDDNTPFNFPPPQKQPQMGFSGSMGPGPGFSSGPGNMSNMPFMGSQNFGPPPGFGSNMRGPFPGSFNQPLHNQPAQNKFGPNTTQGPPPQFGKNFQQQSRPFFDQDNSQQGNFKDNSQQGNFKDNSQHGGFKDNSQHGGFKDNSQHGGFKENSQHGGFKDNSQHGGFKDNSQHGGFKDNSQHGGFNPQQPGIPNLMDGFDPSKGPPSFQKNFGGNQDENDFQDDDDYRDQGEDDYNEYDEYDGSRFENPWDKEQDYEDENNDDNFKEPPDFNKPFGNRSDGPNNFNKPNDRFGSKTDVPFGGGFNRGNVNDRFSDTQVPKDRFSSQEPDNKFLRGPGNKFDRFPESRGPEGNVKDMDDKSSRFSGPQGGDGPGPGGKAFGGRENKVSRFDAPFEERRFGGSRFGPAGEDSPHDQDLDSEGSRDKKPAFDKMNEPGDRFGRGKFPNQNKVSRDKFDNSDNRYSGPGERFGGPGNKFGGSDDRFGGQGGFDGPRGSGGFDGPRGGPGGFDGPRGGPGGFDGPRGGPGGFDVQRGGPGGFDGPRGGAGGFDGQRSGPGGFNGSRGGRFNGPDSRFPPGGRGARDFDSPGRFENDGPGFGGERFGGRKDKPFGRDEDKGEPGNQGRLKGLLPHPTMDRDKIPSLMSLAKPPLLPLPGRQGAPISMDEQDDDFPSGKPDLDDRRQEGQGGHIGRRNEPIPSKEGNSGKTLPPFPHELKTAWDQSSSVNATPVGPGTSVIDYDHKPIDGQIVIEDLNEPESLEPIQVFDYNHGANPGPHMPHQRRDILEEGDDWRNNSDRGPRNRDRGRDDRDRLGPRGRGNWEDDRNRPKERGDRSDDRPRDRDWGSGKRNERDDKRDRDRNDRDRSDRDRDDKRDRDRNDRDRGDKDKNERDRDRSDKDRDRSDKDRGRTDIDRDRSDRRDSRRDEKDNKENRSSGQADRRGGTRDRNQHDNKTKDDNKSKDDNKYSSKDKSSSKEGNASQKQPDQKSQQSPAVLIEDILNNPGRNNRPGKIVVILRGPPGSGKTFVAKLIKDKEVEMGGSAPRILSLDDYFMVEIEKEETDVESGKTVKNKIMEYEYESGMESSYRHSLIKALRKTILDGYFPFIIIDCVHEKLQHYEEINTFAKQKGFQVYICEMDKDLSSCSKRNIHKRTEKEIEDIIKNWEPTPSSQTILDVRSLLQSAAITEVDMEDTTEEATTDEKKDEENKKADEEGKAAEKSGEEKNKKAEPEGDRALFTSKWDTMEFSGEKLDRLDGLGKARKTSNTIRDWLQLPEDYYELSGSNASARSGKRVRWADLEERRQQEKMRAIGFVVGQTDWSRMMDPSFGGDKLAQTKYI